MISAPVPPAPTAHLPEGLVERVQQRLAGRGDQPDAATLAAAIRAEADGVVDDAAMLTLIRRMEDELCGAGPLTPLLTDERTTDVVVNGPSDVRVDRGRGWEPAGVAFADEAAVQRLARRLAAQAGERLDDARPYVDGQLPAGTRLHAILPPLAPDGTCLSLRVLRPARFDLAALDDAGALPGCSRAVVEAVVDARLALLISGGTGSGKTTLLSAVLGRTDPADRIITVEDAAELRPDHPHVVRLVARNPNIEGVGRVGMRELVRQALRMRPERIVIGEVRGAEVCDMLAALSTGHQGGAGTVHANTARDVPARIVALAAQAGMTPQLTRLQLWSAIQVVIHVARPHGRRSVTEIAVLTDRDTADTDSRIVTAVRDGRLQQPGADLLAQLLRHRGVQVPW